MTATSQEPGWLRLWKHSYRLGSRWLMSGVFRGKRVGKVGLQRLLVPLDPWRYYEMGRIADADFTGYCLDVSSPKLLTSLLAAEGRGNWLATDLFTDELDAWRGIDRNLVLEQADVRHLPYPDATFDHCMSVSVIEHVPEEGDIRGMAEMFRVLKPGGLLHLTTQVANHHHDLFKKEALYGNASESSTQGVFFGRSYDEASLKKRLLSDPWEIVHREYAIQKDPTIEAKFYKRAPYSYIYGGALRFICADNFEITANFPTLPAEEIGMVYLQLRKPC